MSDASGMRNSSSTGTAVGSLQQHQQYNKRTRRRQRNIVAFFLVSTASLMARISVVASQNTSLIDGNTTTSASSVPGELLPVPTTSPAPAIVTVNSTQAPDLNSTESQQPYPPTLVPTWTPSTPPTMTNPPSLVPSMFPSAEPTETYAPSHRPSNSPRPTITAIPTETLSAAPSVSFAPSDIPSQIPTTTKRPSPIPSAWPSPVPTLQFSESLNQSFIELVLDGIDREWSNRDVVNFQTVTSLHLAQFWNTVPNSPVMIGIATTRVIPGQINRLPFDRNDPAFFDVAPLQLGYNQTITYRILAPYVFSQIDSQIFTLPFELDQRPYVEALRNVTNNTLPIRIQSIRISIPPTMPPSPGPLVIGQNDRNIIIVTVVITVISLTMAGGYIIYLSRKEDAGDEYSLETESYAEDNDDLIYPYSSRHLQTGTSNVAMALPPAALPATTTANAGAVNHNPPPILRSRTMSEPLESTQQITQQPSQSLTLTFLEHSGSAMGTSGIVAQAAPPIAPASATTTLYHPPPGGNTVSTVGLSSLSETGVTPRDDGSTSAIPPPQTPQPRYPTYSSLPISVISDDGVGTTTPNAAPTTGSGGGEVSGEVGGNGEGNAIIPPPSHLHPVFQPPDSSEIIVPSSSFHYPSSVQVAGVGSGGGGPFADPGLMATAVDEQSVLSPPVMMGFQLEIQDLDDYEDDDDDDNDADNVVN